MVVLQTQAARHISPRNRRSVAQRQNPVNALAATSNLFHDRVRRGLWRLKMHRNRSIPPRILELMTPVRNKRQLHPKLPRRRIKAPRLIPQLSSKHQNPFRFHQLPEQEFVEENSSPWSLCVFL